MVVGYVAGLLTDGTEESFFRFRFERLDEEGAKKIISRAERR